MSRYPPYEPELTGHRSSRVKWEMHRHGESSNDRCSFVRIAAALLTLLEFGLLLVWSPAVFADGGAKDPLASLEGLQKAIEPAKKSEPPKVEPPKPPLVEYYVAIDDKQAGPFVCPKLLELARAHQLTPESRIWRAGLAAWRRAGSDPWFDPIFAAVPPPVNGEMPKLPDDKVLTETPCVEKPPLPPKEKAWWLPFWWPF